MADPAGIIPHLQLIDAVGEMLDALRYPNKVPGKTLSQQEKEIARRIGRLVTSYNRSLRWAKKANAEIHRKEGARA